MTTANLIQADLQTRNAVLLQLEWDSQIDASAVGVTAKDSVVTLTGFIDTYAGKLAAERAAKRVGGVRAVANDIQVRLRMARTDSEIAADAARALEMRAGVPEAVQAVVHSGHVTLTGTVPTLYHRIIAEKAVCHIAGLKGIANHITVVPGVSAADVLRSITQALHHDATTSGRGIGVSVSGHTVTLSGQVATWHERESAERAAMHAPGITEVVNQIDIAWPASPLSDE